MDFLSLDCEGLEADVLAAFPFHRRTFGAIVVDHGHTPAKRQRIALTLVAAGYVRTGCLDHDDAYVPRSSLLLPGAASNSLYPTSKTMPTALHSEETEAKAHQHLTKEAWEPALADIADSCDASATAMVQVACSQATQKIAYATEFHAAAARRVCAAGAFINDAECDAAVFAQARTHCFDNRAAPSSSSPVADTEIYTFPLVSDRSTTTNFTLFRIDVSAHFFYLGTLNISFPYRSFLLLAH